jgi:hypothetical protein
MYRAPADPGWAIQSALGLIALWGRLNGWPAPQPEPDDEVGYETWARLRVALSKSGKVGSRNGR